MRTAMTHLRKADRNIVAAAFPSQKKDNRQSQLDDGVSRHETSYGQCAPSMATQILTQAQPYAIMPIIDSRPEAIAQRQIQWMANRSSHGSTIPIQRFSLKKYKKDGQGYIDKKFTKYARKSDKKKAAKASAAVRILDEAGYADDANYIRDEYADFFAGSSLLTSILTSDDIESETKIEKLKALGTQLKTYYDIHRGYNRYSHLLHGTAWRLMHRGWGYVDKILSLVEKVDASGVTAIVHKVLQLVKKLVDVMGEVTALSDDELREQCTPLLTHSISLSDVKNAFKETKTLVTTAKAAVEAIA